MSAMLGLKQFNYIGFTLIQSGGGIVPNETQQPSFNEMVLIHRK